MGGILQDIWIYRFFILNSVRNKIFSKLSRSKLGGLWIILSPLSQVLIFSLILSAVLKAKLPGIDNKYAYALYLMSGLLCWSLFNNINLGCTYLFIENGNLMKKMRFPRITLPAILLGTQLFYFLALFAAMLFIFLLLGHRFSWTLFWLIPVTTVLVIFSISIGILIAVFAVFIRDLVEAVPILLQLLFWSTPIVYPSNIIPESYRYLLEINPLFHFADAFHNILLYDRAPELGGLLILLAISLGLSGAALATFRRAGDELVDSL